MTPITYLSIETLIPDEAIAADPQAAKLQLVGALAAAIIGGGFSARCSAGHILTTAASVPASQSRVIRGLLAAVLMDLEEKHGPGCEPVSRALAELSHGG
jgi:hypothetical protein